jgi:hypothetical protein
VNSASELHEQLHKPNIEFSPLDLPPIFHHHGDEMKQIEEQEELQA